MSRLVDHWVYGGFLAGLLLVGLTPLVAADWPTWQTAVFLQIPVYMLHQYEEHDADRFRAFVNARIVGVPDALSRRAVFAINVPLVWGWNLAALWLAVLAGPGFGLFAVYLTLVNAAIHAVAWIALGRPNPGCYTGVTLFPLAGAFGLWAIHAAGGGAWPLHALAIAAAIAGHALIVVHIKRRSAALAAAAQ
jgi:hypothetical protein